MGRETREDKGEIQCSIYRYIYGINIIHRYEDICIKPVGEG